MNKINDKTKPAHECQCEQGGCCEAEECSCENDHDECCKDVDQIKELQEHLLRTQAELVNYRRRKDEETSRLLKYQGEELIRELLPIVDDLERAIMMDDQHLNDELTKFLQGFKMMYANLELILASHEIKSMDCLHKTFDPQLHQAVLVDKNKDVASGIITDVLAKGYTYKDKVIRPAMVKVNE